MYILTQISDEDMSRAPDVFQFNPPPTKQAYYYRQVFDKYYPGQAKWLPFYWMPKWTDATDPSARTHKHCKH